MRWRVSRETLNGSLEKKLALIVIVVIQLVCVCVVGGEIKQEKM
jgi:hypothetical protein